MPAQIAPAADAKPAPQPASHDGIAWDERPTTAPTEVELVTVIKRWEVVSGQHEVLKLSGLLEMYWTDPRLAGYPLKRGLPEAIWRPEIIACQGFKMDKAEKYAVLPKFYNKEGGEMSDGRLQFVVEFSFGEAGWNISDDLERMRLFPFDSTRVDVSIIFSGTRRKEMLDLEIKPVLTRPNPPNRVKAGHPLQHIEWLCTRHSDDYEMVAVSYALGSHPRPGFFSLPHHTADTRMADLLLSFQIKRTPSFYVAKGIRPLFLVALFGFAVFGLESNDLGTRLSILAALFLTTYAVQWIVIERLPRLPFSTVLDHVAQSVVTALLLMCLVSLASYRLGRDGCDDDGCGFDRKLGGRVDAVGAAVVAAFLLLETVAYRIVYSASRSTKTGWSRPWRKGGYLRNKRFVPYEAYRLVTDEAFVAVNGRSFLGAGARVDDVRAF